MTDHILAMTTLSTEGEAAKLASQLVERRLIACATILPGARSIYRYRGKVEDESESVVLMKTRSELTRALRDTLVALHPYDVFELIVVPIDDGNEDYLAWIDENVGTRGVIGREETE